jgi:Putative auto-transporter adhesin, head GIN domain
MYIRLFAALLAMLAIAPAHAADRSFLVGSFDELIVEGDVQVTLITGGAPSAKASGDKERLNSLKVDRQGKTLRIRMQGLQASRKVGEPLQVALTGRNIRKLIMRGNGRISASDINMTDVRLELRGSGEINIASLKAERFVALLVGNGKLNIATGTATASEILIDGGTTIEAAGLKTGKLKLTQNGPANVHFSVDKSADITNSGTGAITIDGNATCFIRAAGGASINCKNVGS